MTFFFDNCLSNKISNGFKAFGEDVIHLTDIFDEDTKDVEFLNYIGDNQMALITKDLRIRRNPVEKEQLIKSKIITFFLGGKNLNTWQRIVQLVRGWQKIKELADSTKPPFCYIVRPSGETIDEVPI